MPIFRGARTARYAMTREVAAVCRFFPLSMSDFKPGDKKYCVSEQRHDRRAQDAVR